MGRSIIRTDRWPLQATAHQQQLMRLTVSEYRKFCRALCIVVLSNWPKLANDPAFMPSVERLMHPTAKNPHPKHRYFASRFHSITGIDLMGDLHQRHQVIQGVNGVFPRHPIQRRGECQVSNPGPTGGKQPFNGVLGAWEWMDSSTFRPQASGVASSRQPQGFLAVKVLSTKGRVDGKGIRVSVSRTAPNGVQPVPTR